jgi:hypothetical protein
LLLKVVDVSVKDLNEQLHVGNRIHARVRNLQGLLSTFKDAFAITIWVDCLFTIVSLSHNRGTPPQVAASIYGATLIRFLQQFSSVKRTLGNEGIVVVQIET